MLMVIESYCIVFVLVPTLVGRIQVFFIETVLYVIVALAVVRYDVAIFLKGCVIVPLSVCSCFHCFYWYYSLSLCSDSLYCWELLYGLFAFY